MNARFKMTLKAWPVIAVAAIAICFLTQTAAGWIGVNLQEQENVAQARELLRHAFDSWKIFGVAAFYVAQVVAIMPVLEEIVFRWLLFKLPAKHLAKLSFVIAIVSSTLFSAVHYLIQPFPDNAFIALFFFGLAQCWLYRRTGRLWCPMLNHALFNLTNLALLPFVSA